MEVIPVTDLPKDKAMTALKKYRMQFYNEDLPSKVLEQVYDKVGGRLSYLNRVAKSPDVMRTCQEICRAEKTWFLNKCWILGKEMDDDVMDEQKYSVSTLSSSHPSSLPTSLSFSLSIPSQFYHTIF